MSHDAQDRRLDWEGCVNVRDLGGLPTATGFTRRGAVVRGDHPCKLTERGWRAALDHGVCTIVELGTLGVTEDLPDATPRPADIETLRFDIENLRDAEFKARFVDTHLWCTPLYYADALARWPAAHAEVIRAIADARPGAVLVHCRRGHDRTGIISVLLLALAGVAPEAIAADYALSDAQMPDHERAAFRAAMQRAGTTPRATIEATLASLAIEDYLLGAGLSRATLAAARARLVEPA